MSTTSSTQCPICKRELRYEHKQFRSDDEPATLVVGCEIHGPVAQLVLQLFSNKGIAPARTSSVRAESKPVLDTDVCPKLVSVDNIKVWYAIRLKILGDIDVHWVNSYYGITSTCVIIDSQVRSCKLHVNDPLWCHGDLDVTSSYTTLDRADPHCDYYEVLISKQKTASTQNNIDYHGVKYYILYDDVSQTRMVLLSDDRNNTYTVWCQIEGYNESTSLAVLRARCMSVLTTGVLKQCTIVVDPSHVQWYASLKVNRHGDADAIICIDRQVLKANARGLYICAEGRYAMVYIHKEWVCELTLKDNTMKCIHVGQRINYEGLPLVAIGYAQKDNTYMTVVSCIDTALGLAADTYTVTSLIETMGYLRQSNSYDSNQWRSFTPVQQTSIRFVARKGRCDPQLNFTVFHTLMCSTLHRIIDDTKLEVMFIHGAPRKEYEPIQRVCRVCWIYDYEWDDPTVEGFEHYNTTEQATLLCSKGGNSVCGCKDWQQGIKCVSTMLYVLDSIPDLMSLDKSKMIAVVHNNTEFSGRVSYGVELYTISTGTLHSILSCLNVAVIPYDRLLVSESVLPYVRDVFELGF